MHAWFPCMKMYLSAFIFTRAHFSGLPRSDQGTVDGQNLASLSHVSLP